MPKRFTDTEKWKKPFIRGLPTPYKLLWFYILDDCNHAGIWEVDLEVAEIRTGEKFSEKDALRFFGGRVQKISEGKWFLPDFIFFQYGDLNEKNRLHLSVIQILNKYEIKPLRSPLEGVKDKDKVKDKERDKDKEPFGKSENLLLVPEMFEIFKNHNPNYPGTRDKDYKPLFSIASFLCEQGKLSGSPDLHRAKIIEAWDPICQVVKADKFYSQKTLSTISNSIQEILQIAKDGKFNGKPVYGSKERAEKLNRMFAERYPNG
jgi:hypothetical protein